MCTVRGLACHGYDESIVGEKKTIASELSRVAAAGMLARNRRYCSHVRASECPSRSCDGIHVPFDPCIVTGVQTLRPTLLFSGFRHFVP